MRKSPVDNGCWFCHSDEGNMFFSWEFDTYFHLKCLEQCIRCPDDQEAQIIGREFDLRCCETCDGTGEVHSHNPICWTCHGKGFIKV